MAEEIQHTEIRGVTLKWLIRLVIVVGAGMAIYFGIASRIELGQYRITDIEKRIIKLESEYDELKKQVNELSHQNR